jgi:hypothetical protein
MSTIRVSQIESLDAANTPLIVNSELQLNTPITILNKTQAEIDALTGVARGQILFNTDTETLTQYNGVKWVEYNQTKVNLGLVVALG